MTNRELRSFIRSMREMGAHDICVDGVRVQFPPLPDTVDVVGAVDAQIEKAIQDIHEEKMDAEEVSDAKSAKRTAEKARDLLYAHG